MCNPSNKSSPLTLSLTLAPLGLSDEAAPSCSCVAAGAPTTPTTTSTTTSTSTTSAFRRLLTPKSAAPSSGKHHRRRSSLMKLLTLTPNSHKKTKSHYAVYAPTSTSTSTSTSSRSCAETDTESVSSSDIDVDIEEHDEEEEEIQLITHKKVSTKPFSPVLNFSHEFGAAVDSSAATLELPHFVSQASRHDIYALRDLLLLHQKKWNCVKIVDEADATNFRRFAYKKDNVNHHIQKICQEASIELDYRIALVLDVDDDDTPFETVVSLVHEVKKHPEVRSLQIRGHLNSTQEVALLKQVTSLVRLDDRDWDLVTVYTAHLDNDNGDNNNNNNDNTPNDYEQWRSTMEHYMGVFSQLYETRHIPIDIRPFCATV